MQTNIIYNADCISQLHDHVDNGSVDLVIADPPYFKVVGEKWDYAWRTESDYLDWSRSWLEPVVDTLRLGGSIYLFGYFRMLCRLLPILEDLGLELRQQIIIDKGLQAVAGRATKQYKQFPNVTESILFLTKDSKPFVKSFLKQRQIDLGLSAKQINEALGVKSNGGGMWSIYTGNNVCKQLPTEDIWNKLSVVLDFDMPYSKIAQTFNAQPGISDVWKDINFYKDRHRIHPTQKPLPLIERLLRASSNEGDLVLDPFIGSGSTAVACRTTNRRYIGFEIDPEYYQKAVDRVTHLPYKLL